MDELTKKLLSDLGPNVPPPDEVAPEHADTGTALHMEIMEEAQKIHTLMQQEAGIANLTKLFNGNLYQDTLEAGMNIGFMATFKVLYKKNMITKPEDFEQ